MSAASIELADVFKQFGDEHEKKYGSCMLPSQRRVVNDVKACMTQDMGGSHYSCNDCDGSFWRYHGCRNRSCPKCHTEQIRKWLEARKAEMLPCDYYHIVATVPSELRPLFLRHQKILYGMLMKVAADAVRELAADPRHVGAEVGILAVLHTWTGQMLLHPHVHMLVTGGGVTSDKTTWKDVKPGFLIPVRKLSKLISKKFQETLKSQHFELYKKIVSKVWKKEWCSFCKPFGKGSDAVLKYLARYVFRIAISNTRILKMDPKNVTFKYKDHDADCWRIETILGVEFMRRFLMHVLPKGFHKVRYYGLWHSSKRVLHSTIKILIQQNNLKKENTTVSLVDCVTNPIDTVVKQESICKKVKCRLCGSENVVLKETLSPKYHSIRV